MRHYRADVRSSRIDGVGPRYVDQRLAIGEPFQGLLPLVGIKLARPAETHATRHSALPAGIGARFDQVPLERGEAGQDRHQKLALRRRGVAPGVVQRSELGATLGKGMQDVEQIAGRACQAVEAGHDQQVVALQPLQDLGQLGPIAAPETFSW